MTSTQPTQPQPPKIKKPLNSFFYFRRDLSNEFRKRHPKARTGDISKLASTEWANASPEVKRKYERLSFEAFQRHKEQYPDFEWPSRRKSLRRTAVKKKEDKKAPSESPNGESVYTLEQSPFMSPTTTLMSPSLCSPVTDLNWSPSSSFIYSPSMELLMRSSTIPTSDLPEEPVSQDILDLFQKFGGADLSFVGETTLEESVEQFMTSDGVNKELPLRKASPLETELPLIQ